MKVKEILKEPFVCVGIFVIGVFLLVTTLNSFVQLNAEAQKTCHTQVKEFAIMNAADTDVLNEFLRQHIVIQVDFENYGWSRGGGWTLVHYVVCE